MARSKRDEDDLDSESQSNDSSRSSSESEAESANSDDRGDNREEIDEDKEDSDDDEEMEASKVEVKGESDSDEEREADEEKEADEVMADLDEDDDREEESENDEDKDDDKDEDRDDDKDEDQDDEKEEKDEEMEEEKAAEKDDESDSDDDREVTHAVDADDVLADLNLDDDDDEDDEGREATGGDEREEEQPEEIPITRIEVEIPKIPTELGNDIHFVKLPNFLSVDTHPYDPSWYEDEIDEDEILDEEGRHRLKLKVESTIRWRTVVDENGVSLKESNARIVKWSDGSMSLHLGSEIFDIHKQSLMAGDNNHLFIRQGTGLQGQAVFKTKLTFRPHSTDSFTHRKMTLSLAERSHKTQKIRVLPNVGKDPEAHRSEMIKKEEDKLKASIRRENKMRRVREKAPFRGPTASYLEPDAYDDDDDDDGGVSLSAIKKRYKKGGAGYNIYTDSDDDSDLDKKKSSSERKRTAKVVESDDEDDDK